MKKLVEQLKRYGMFIALAAVCLIAFAKKNSYLNTAVVSNADSQIVFSTENSVLEQTWQPHVKKITEIKVPYTAVKAFEADVQVEIVSDDASQVIGQATGQHSFVQGEEGTLEFPIGMVKLIPGERYRIRFSFRSFSDDGEILIDAGSNYMGCSIDGEAVNAAVAISITFVKNSRLFFLFAMIFPLFSFSFLGMVLWQRKWEDVVGLALIFTISILYLFGVTGILEAGIYMIYILSGISLFAASFLYVKKKMDMGSLLSMGLFVWFILLACILMSNHGVWLARSDEYTHWGLAAKDMFYYNSLAKHADTTVVLVRYMPFSTLTEYFVLYLNGLFSEDLLYVGFQLILVSILVVFCSLLNKKHWYMLPALGVMIFVPVTFFQDVFNCIYVDPLLAVFAAYVFIGYYDEEKNFFYWLRILAGLFALVMTKDIGVVIAGLLSMLIFADIVCRQIKERKIRVKEFLQPLCCLTLVIVCFFGWQVYLSTPISEKNVVEVQEKLESQTDGEQTVSYQNTISASNMSEKEFVKLLTGKGQSYQYKVMKNLIVELFDGDTYHLGNMGVSYMDISIIILLLIMILGSFHFWREKRKRMLSFGIFSFIMGVGYCSCLGILYIFTFSKNEALNLASHERYLASYLCAVVIAFFYFVLKQLSELTGSKERKYADVAIVSIIAIMLICVPVSNLVWTNRDISISAEMKFGYAEIEEILRSFSRRADKVYFICSNSNGGSRNMFRNSASPLLIPYMEGNLAATEESAMIQKDIDSEQGIESKEKTILTVSEWEERLRQCDYVFIMNADAAFRNDYAELFVEPDTIKGGTFYQIFQGENGVKLDYIGEVGTLVYY